MTTFQHATVRGVKLFYREAGSKASPTIVLLHGFPSSSHMFRDLIPQLADKFHVIAPDYVGFGYSDAPPDDALGALLALGAVVAAPPPHAAKVRTATLASAPTLEILIRSTPPRIRSPGRSG